MFGFFFFDNLWSQNWSWALYVLIKFLHFISVFVHLLTRWVEFIVNFKRRLAILVVLIPYVCFWNVYLEDIWEYTGLLWRHSLPQTWQPIRVRIICVKPISCQNRSSQIQSPQAPRSRQTQSPRSQHSRLFSIMRVHCRDTCQFARQRAPVLIDITRGSGKQREGPDVDAIFSV